MSTNSYSILSEVNRIIGNQVQEEKISAEMTALITATLKQMETRVGRLPEIKVLIKNKKRRNLLLLGILSWYLPKELGIFLRLQIEKETNSRFELSSCRIICKSKAIMESFLISIVTHKGPEHLFGNILNKNLIKESLHSYKIKIFDPEKLTKPRIPRTIGVGYKDKGHLPDKSKWTETNDYSFTSRQNEIERNRQVATDFDKLNEGFLS